MLNKSIEVDGNDMDAYTPGVIASKTESDVKHLIITMANAHSLSNIIRQQRGSKYLGYMDNTRKTVHTS